MSCITTSGQIEESFDSHNLTASYSARSTPEGGVQIDVDVYDGTQHIATIPHASFTAEQASGWRED